MLGTTPVRFHKPEMLGLLGSAHLSLFLVDRFCSTPSIRFLKHWARTSCLGGGWLFIRLALSSLKYCGRQNSLRALTSNLGPKRAVGEGFFQLHLLSAPYSQGSFSPGPTLNFKPSEKTKAIDTFLGINCIIPSHKDLLLYCPMVTEQFRSSVGDRARGPLSTRHRKG